MHGQRFHQIAITRRVIRLVAKWHGQNLGQVGYHWNQHRSKWFICIDFEIPNGIKMNIGLMWMLRIWLSLVANQVWPSHNVFFKTVTMNYFRQYYQFWNVISVSEVVGIIPPRPPSFFGSTHFRWLSTWEEQSKWNFARMPHVRLLLESSLRFLNYKYRVVVVLEFLYTFIEIGIDARKTECSMCQLISLKWKLAC